MGADAVLIVGAGHGGFQLAASLRQLQFTGRICLVNDEAYLPYQRPPLSKTYINQDFGPEQLSFRPQSFYSDQGIEIIAGRAASINRAARQLVLESGREIPYGHLVLATGARNRSLDASNSTLGGVRYLRTANDANALRAAIRNSKRIVIVGAGFVGLEFAATARRMGIEVSVVELGTRAMARAVTPNISAHFEARHRQAGVTFHFEARVTDILEKRGELIGVTLDNGEVLPCDLVLVGIGAVPNVELAENARLPTRAGIIVDDCLLTSDPSISAIGDCALFSTARFGGALRLESVQNATDQARCVAARLMGEPRPYDSLPWFWSDQGDDKLQIVGLISDCDEVVVRGDALSGMFSTFCYKSGQLVGIESVNRSNDHMFGRKLLSQNRTISADQARNSALDLKAMLRS